MDDVDAIPAFDDEAFRLALDAIRQRRCLTRAEVAQQSGVSPATVTRIGQGKFPDMDSFAALVVWMERDANEFIVRYNTLGDRQQLPLETVLTTLMHDARLSSDDAQLIYSLVSVLITRLRK